MKAVWMVMLLCAAGLAQTQGVDANVNERYTVDSVEITGIDQGRISKSLHEDLQRLVGEKFSQEKLDRLADIVRKAFPGRSLAINVSRGSKPESVKITFQLGGRRRHFDLEAPKAIYSSRQGWSGEVDAHVQAGSSVVSFGVLSDGDALVERFSGVRARYENRSLGTERVRMAFEFDSFHNIWNGATVEAAQTPGAPGIYRTRQNFEPAAVIQLARPLTLTLGTSFQRFQTQFPAAHIEASNAVIGTLRYDRLLEESGPSKHRLEAGYSLRAATRTLGSDYVYARHSWDLRYALWRGNHKFTEHFIAGLLTGTAPMFDRFVLGNSATLRGWNKYDIAPLGGDRVAHNSMEYRYRALTVFYDTGAVWARSQPAVARHAAGAGLHLGDLALLVAFPLRSGQMDPVFILGLNL